MISATTLTSHGRVDNPYRRAERRRATNREPERTEQSESQNLIQRLQNAQIEWMQLFTRQRVSENVHSHGTRPVVLTSHNQRTNEEWGDSLECKTATHTRLYSLNINGLTLDKRGGQFDELCKVAKEVQAEILCCQEHNLDTMQTSVKTTIFETLRQHWSRSRITMGTTPIPFATAFKPGGTMLIATNSITGRIISQTIDKWGRWVSHTYRGKEQVKITIISVYQVVTDRLQIGISTAAAQQRSLLIQSNDPLNAPRKAFKRDLKRFATDCITAGQEIMIVGDFNEVLGSEIDGMSKIAAELNLIDVIRFRHQEASPATYSRGKSRLDYGLATQHIVDSLTGCGYEPFNARFSTDHRAYYFDFNTDQLFGSATQTLANPKVRMLKSNNAEQVTNYLKETYDRMLARNVFNRAEQLSMPGNRHAFAERLDKDVVKASLDAEKAVKPYGEPAWSVALDKARRKGTILKKCLSLMRTGLDCGTIIDRKIISRSIDMVIPTIRPECSSQLRLATAEVNQIAQQSYQRRDTERNERIR
jgi:exonuclease III